MLGKPNTEVNITVSSDRQHEHVTDCLLEKNEQLFQFIFGHFSADSLEPERHDVVPRLERHDVVGKQAAQLVQTFLDLHRSAAQRIPTWQRDKLRQHRYCSSIIFIKIKYQLGSTQSYYLEPIFH